MVTGPIIPDEVIRVKRNPWADNFIRPLLITVMIMCINISLVNLVRLVNPAWRGSYFLLGMLITTVEAIYSYRVLQKYRTSGISVLRYRIAEAALLLLTLKLLSFMDKPLSLVLAQFRLMWQTPSAFFDNELYMVLTLASLAWFAATFTVADFEALYDPYLDNRGTLSSLAERFFWGGGILVIISGITQWIARAGISSLTDWQRPSIGGIILNVLVYFMVGLVLLSQVNLVTHLVRWRVQKITVAPGLTKQWVKYGIIFFVIVTAVAFLLPTQYGMGLLDTAGVVIRFIIGILFFIFQLFIVLLTLPLGWLLSFFGATAPDYRNIPPPPPPVLPDGGAGTAYPWLEFLRSLVFWLLALGVGGYLLKSYLDDHPDLLKQIKSLKFFLLLFKLLAQLWRQMWGMVQTGLEMLPQKVRPPAQPLGKQSLLERFNWLRLRGLAPRERIIYYYLNILKQAEKSGPPRRESQTPYEYEPDLQKTAQDAQSEVHQLTDVFVHARYSLSIFDDDQASVVKQRWQRIRKALRQRHSRDKT